MGFIETDSMVERSSYSAVELLRNGRRIEIRALKPDDRAGFLAAVDRSSTQSLYRRFFGVQRHFTEQEIAFFLNVDFVNHVALVAVAEENGEPIIVGGGRYVVLEPGKAEVAFAVIDQYQGQGIGVALMHHLVVIARAAGLQELTAEVLPDNVAMLKVFAKSGVRHNTRREAQVVHVALQLILIMRCPPPGKASAALIFVKAIWPSTWPPNSHAQSEGRGHG